MRRRVGLRPKDLEKTLAAPPAPSAEEQEKKEQEARLEEVHRLMLDLVADLLLKKVAVLSFRDKGCLAAHWTDDWGYGTSVVAERLGMSERAVRVAKWKALDKARCASGQCHAPSHASGCAHRLGKTIWEGIVDSIVQQVRRNQC